MIFNSIDFAIFLALVFIIYWSIPNKYRWILILCANIFFYLSFDIKYVLLLVLNIIMSYLCALQIEKTKKKSILVISIILCLSSLFICKYLDFSFNVLEDIGIKFAPSSLKLILPVGISFYTFEIISYLVDVYREKMIAERNLGYYAAYVSFFPTITSGPIERANSLIPQLKNEKTFKYEEGTYGLKLIAWGLFKKIVVADNLAVYVDTVFDGLSGYLGFNFILIAIFYAIQIYCDFSGYSDMARGTAKLLGINITDNFKSPYFSTSIKDFWSRWHISLTNWLREYIYIPLGGNRKGNIRRYINILIVFLVSGLWHGASYTFIVWGLIHAILQIIETIFNIKPSNNKKSIIYWIKTLITFVLVTIAWLFFRADTISDSLYILKSIPIGITNLRQYFITGIYSFNNTPTHVLLHCLVYFIPLFIFDFFNKDMDVIEEIGKKSKPIRYTLYALLILVILLFHSTAGTNYIYFKF